jgi:cytochrome b561
MHMERATPAHYSTPARIIHWLTAFIVVIAFIYGPGGREERIYSVARDSERQLHETLGVCVLVLSLLRILWAAIDRRPAAPAAAPWMNVASRAVQGTLYVLLFAVPLSAVAGAWLEAHPVTLLWGIAIAPPIAESHAVGATIAELHGWLGDAILWLAGLHAAAALFHHYVLKDSVLASMLPARNFKRQ